MVDLTFLKSFTKGNDNKIKRYISMYLKMAPQTFDKMEASAQNAEWDQLAITAHSFKPQSDFMGIQELKELLVEIEASAKSGELDNLPQLVKKARCLHEDAALVLKGQL